MPHNALIKSSVTRMIILKSNCNWNLVIEFDDKIAVTEITINKVVVQYNKT